MLIRAIAAALAAILALAASFAAAEDAAFPRLQTLQSYIEDLEHAGTLDVGDPMKVFAFVLNSLPERVKVYPTENYYYFRFVHGGTPYSGNIRIEVSDKAPTLHFAYYQTETAWHPDENAKQVVLGEKDGVTLEKKDRLLYRIAYKEKSVLFALNDLSTVKPPAAALAPNERFIGPVFDDSGVRFFLVFNDRLKIFLYVLDESVKPVEEMFPARAKSRILLGKRTGFAYFRDWKIERKILVGAFEDNVLLNTHFDGPFDQLPDNFIEGETLRSAILAANPRLKGKIDRYGRAFERDIRYAIKPYLNYVEVSDLAPIEACADKRVNEPGYYKCFVSEEAAGEKPKRSRP